MAKGEVDTFLKALLTSGPFDPADNWLERACNEKLAVVNEVRADPDCDELDEEEAIDILRTAVIALVHGSEDPFDLPMETIRHCLENPIRPFFSLPHRKRIDGPGKAIRAMCIECQGMDASAVKNCAAINCFLWPFRMGTNGFYGRLIDGLDEDADIVEDEAEVEAMEAERVSFASEEE